MEITSFAGLTALDEGDPITIDGASFLIKNPRTEDKLLRVGAVTHRHDGHVAIPSPHVSLTGSVTASGGSLPTNTTLAVTYTVVDQHGGETTAAAPLVLTTGAGVNNPTIAPSASVVTSAGIMPDGSYFYALTYTDGQGGETLLGPQTLVSIPPGYASASIVLSGLASELAPHGVGSEWRLWRSYEGADWHLVTQGSTNTFDDGGFDPPDNPARPPQVNTTQGAYSMVVTIPTAAQEPAIASGSSINIYLAEDTSFADPSFYESAPIASAGQTFVISSLAVSQGAPPRVSLSISGANQIDPDTDLLDWHWKRPVATQTALPSGSQGDVRMTLDSGHLWGAIGGSGAATWHDWTDLTQFAGALASGVSLFASGGAVTPREQVVEFTGASGATVSVRDLGGGSALVTIAAAAGGGGGGGGGSFTASAGGAQASITGFLGFAASGGASVQLVNGGGGSATILIGAGAGSVIENVNRAFVKGLVTLPDVTTATIDDLTLTGSASITFPPAASGKSFSLVLRQDGVGGRTVTWPTVDWLGGGGTPTLSTLASGVDVASFVCPDGVTWIGSFAPGYFVASGAGGGGGLTSFVASGGGGSATVTTMLGFSASGGASVSVRDLGGGSAVVLIGASGLMGPTGPTGAAGAAGTAGGTNVGGSAASPLFAPASYVEFVPAGSASAGIAVNIANQGGGSAQVQIGLTKQVFSALQQAQSAMAQNTWTKIQFAAPAFDTTGWYDSTNHRFKPTQPGWYEISGLVGFAVHSASTQGYLVAAVKNGDSVNNLNYLGSAPITQTQVNPGAIIGASRAIFLNGSTDYVEIFAYTSDPSPTTFYAVGSFSGGLLA